MNDKLQDPASMLPLPPPDAGKMVASVTYVHVDAAGTPRILSAKLFVPTGGGAELERLRLLEAGVVAVQQLDLRLETTGWATDAQLGARRARRWDPSSGEGSPL